MRRKTKEIKIGNMTIGGVRPIAIQSMVKVDSRNLSCVIKQIKSLEKAGCEIVRVAVKDKESAEVIGKIKQRINIPLVADIHFSYELALLSIKNGADKIRLNPGNIYKKDEVRKVVEAAKKAKIPIRVGINSGSLRRVKGQGLRGKVEAGQLVKSALDYIKMLEGFGFCDIVVSLKASNILDTIESCRKISTLCTYPLHLGLTATGVPYSGAIKSGIALGVLLSEGIGDTIRVSLTDEPESEIKAAKIILEALGLRHFGPEIISCPTCGRCEVDLVNIVKELENRLLIVNSKLSTRPMKLAVMGCVVNGPGEAKEADIGIAFGKKEGLLFRHGKPIKKVSADKCTEVLLEEMNKVYRAPA